MVQAKVETVTCPWCKESFEIDPTSSAAGFNCLVCGIESSLDSFRNPDHRPNAIEIGENAAQAATANLYRHTAAYVYIDRRTGNESIGSGTLVKISKRLLLATVAHTKPRDGTLAWIKKSGLIVPEPIFCVVQRIVSTDDETDVGVFELTAHATTMAGVEPIGIDRIHDGGCGSPSVKARLIGYPGQWIVTAPPLPHVKRFHALAYGCETIEPARWGAIPHRNGIVFNDKVHVVIHYSDDVVSYDNKLPVPPGTPNPHGMSGGGLWQRPEPTPDDVIWTPSDLCLIGIQSDWLAKAGYLRSIQVIHWLKLVADHFSDLRGELENHFPRLTEV
jgi:hypothetical protein